VPDQRTEFEIALRDSISSELRKIADEMRNVQRVARDMSDSAGTGVDKFSKSVGNATETIKKSREELNVVGSFFSGFAKGLLAPLGSVAALEQFGKALYNVSVQRIQLELFSKSVGFTTQNISIMTQTLANMGISSEQARNAIAGIGKSFREASATGVGSQLIRTLNQMGEGAWAQNLLKVIRTGDFAQAHEMMTHKYETWTRDAQFWFTSQTGIDEAMLAEYAKFNKGVKAEIDLNLKNTEDFVRQVNQNWTNIVNATRIGVDEVLGLYKKLERGERTLGQTFRDLFGIQGVPHEKGTPIAPEITNPRIRQQMGLPPLPMENAPDIGRTPILPGGRFQPTDDDRLPRGARPMMFQGRNDNELLKTEEDSNRVLKEIRDLVDPSRMGGQTGARTATGALQATLGGFRRGLGGGRGAGPGGEPGPLVPEGGKADDESGAGLAGSEYLKARRQRMADELNADPELKKQFAAIISAEHESDPVAVAESALNRAEYTKSSVAARLTKAFYGPLRNPNFLPGRVRQLERDPKRMARLMAAIDAALAGSNLLKGATDQGSGADPNVGWSGGRIKRFGEVYNDWGGGPGGHEGARRFREEQQRRVREGAQGRDNLTTDEMQRRQQRETIDKQSMRGGWDGDSDLGTAKIAVDFKNMPRGVSATADADGIFKELKVARSYPIAAKDGTVADSFNTWAYG